MVLRFLHEIVQGGIVARANQAAVAYGGWRFVHNGVLQQRHDVVFATTISAQRPEQWRLQTSQDRRYRGEPFGGSAQRRQVPRIRRAAGDSSEQTLNVVDAVESLAELLPTHRIRG